MPACILCAVYNPRRDPLWPDMPPACGPCRARPGADLAEIVDLYATLPQHLVPGASIGPKVSGSREPALPVDVGVVDLMLPARAGSVTDSVEPAVVVEQTAVRWTRFDAGQYVTEEIHAKQRRVLYGDDGWPLLQFAGDQIGNPSVPSVLDSWASEWAEIRHESRPVPTVASLCGWLSDRTGWALSTLEDEPLRRFADEIGSLVRILRAACRLNPPRPQRIVGVPCQGCDYTATLYRVPGTDEVECHNQDCRRVYRLAELADNAQERKAA